MEEKEVKLNQKWLGILLIGIGIVLSTSAYGLSTTGRTWNWEENYRDYAIYYSPSPVGYSVTDLARTQQYGGTFLSLQDARDYVDTFYSVEPPTPTPILPSISGVLPFVSVGALALGVILFLTSKKQN